MLAKYVKNLCVFIYITRRELNCERNAIARSLRKRALNLIFELQGRRNNRLRGGGFSHHKRGAFRQSLGDNA